ncbi:MAG: hypothetical protein ACQETD_09760, partial [Pseudomonadota bacterium]
MSEANDPRPALPPALFWRILVIGNIASLVVLLFFFHRMARAPFWPEYGPWLLGIGLVVALPALLYRRRARQTMAQMAGQSDNARRLAQFNQVVYGCATAQLPGLLGTIYYLA